MSAASPGLVGLLSESEPSATRHTSAAFAMAASIAGEVGRVRPDLEPLATAVGFAGAAAVGVARVVQRMHWASDLPLAAAIGIWSGNAVEAHTGARTTATSALRGVSVMPAPDRRLMIGWSSSAADSGLP